jgi:mannose-6-phosphate isomerase-like protein (cupin superfamily)
VSKDVPIHDLYTREIAVEKDDADQHWTALQDSDHLLRRFGLAEVVRACSETKPSMNLRIVADEVWALIEGRVEFAWHDLRTESPTYGNQHRFICERPTLVLAPFGVAFGFRSLDETALLLRLATHPENTHEGDRRLPWEFLE